MKTATAAGTRQRPRRWRRSEDDGVRLVGALAAFLLAAGAFLVVGDGSGAGAAIVPTIELASADSFAVLGGSTVTNDGNSVLNGHLGLYPGTSVTGFPPGQVIPPHTIHTTDAMAHQAQNDVTAAYVEAAGRPVDATTTADLTDLVLQGGVYAGPDHSPLSLTGPLVLDGAGDPRSVFIFQTDSTLITGSSSTVSLVNGAQACNVFWQVGSSATLGTGSVFVGNILALTSVTVNDSVTVEGRALARNGAVTLLNDTFIAPACDTTPPTTVTPTTVTPTTVTPTTVTPTTLTPTTLTPTTLTAIAPTTSTTADIAASTTTTTGIDHTTQTARRSGPTSTNRGGVASPPSGPTTPGTNSLPATGSDATGTLVIAIFAIVLGALALLAERSLGRSTR